MRIQMVLFVILMAELACKSKSHREIDQHPDIHAVDGAVTLEHDVVPRAEVTVPAVEKLIPGGIIRRPPLTLTDVRQFPLLAELAGPLGWGATTRWTGQGLLRQLQAEDGAARAHRLVLRLSLDYEDTEGLRADYPLLDDELVEGLPRTAKGLIRFVPAEVRLYLIASDDGKAYRIVLDSLTVYEGTESIGRRGTTAARPMPALTSVSYAYPDADHQTQRLASVIFDHRIIAVKGVYRGHQQSSPWLPLQPDAMTGPFNVRVRVTEVSSRRWSERISADLSRLTSPLVDVYKGVR